ncbi:VOC family protein [Haloactinopolyspora sp.]|uniref:VOC family protein n=1 Tax=Haloactinopolyspora sp. TaxID=1966353 RepID=UPI002626FEAE|nr:VOC family protein [Haloactinopolyspora sp.]
MIGSFQCLVLDCPAPLELAAFYQSILGGEVNRPDKRWVLDDHWATLHTDTTVLAFQRAEDYQPPAWPDPQRPQQLHIDVGVDDLDTAERQVLGLGAQLLDRGERDRDWRVYADPAGHPFCLCHVGD